jgi:hypothetical protein
MMVFSLLCCTTAAVRLLLLLAAAACCCCCFAAALLLLPKKDDILCQFFRALAATHQNLHDEQSVTSAAVDGAGSDPPRHRKR